jgi:hypothetical protein
MTSPNDYQVGGTHYRTNYQHWDWVEDNGIGYLEGVATKYLCRWKGKNGLEDLKKARHYTMKAIQRYVNTGRGNRCDGALSPVFKEFASDNNLGALESAACFALAYWTSDNQLHDAVNAINQLILLHYPQEFNKEMTK